MKGFFKRNRNNVGHKKKKIAKTSIKDTLKETTNKILEVGRFISVDSELGLDKMGTKDE